MAEAVMTAEKPIKPDRLLKELSEIWSTMAAPEANGDASGQAHGDGVLRACAMTLFSFVDDEEDSAVLGEILAHLMKEHPSRSIVVRLKEGEDFLDARAFAQCWMPFGHRRQICCEQVEITASMNRLADVAAIVGPLAVPDLPRVILLRSSRIVRAGALRKILPLGDKIIVDSSRAGAPGFGELGGLLDAGHLTGDLAWTRITDLRALIAQLLEHRTVGRIVIEYAGREAGAETRYLLAWLESSLCSAKIGLKGSGGDGGGKISAVLVDSDLSIRVVENAAEYDIAGLHQRAAFGPGTDEQLLNVELGIVVHDPVFERALNRITA
jgi:glucose-6-phosphate dehydrogenase assembly protein OpcA